MAHNQHVIDETLAQRVRSAMNTTDDAYRAAFADFQARFPAYANTRTLDELRETDYHRLDESGQIYLDYTGGGLYATSQLQRHMNMLLHGVYGNPHSSNPTSLAMTKLDEDARRYVAKFFNADPDEYTIIFTPNASGALRLVGESYPFEDNGQYLLIFDNHNSVNGIREFARNHHAPVTYSPLIPPDLRIDEAALMTSLEKAIPGGNNLFAYPAQSNFSGVQHPLAWVEIAQARGWDVLLDCAAFAPTNRLDLHAVKPDFVPLSFYKIFGYPTGVGTLIAKRSKLEKLRRPWFAGGTIAVASVQGDAHVMAEGSAAFEDGTIDYLNLPAVEIGLEHIQRVGIDVIHERVMALTGYLLEELTQLRHDNGSTLIKVYGPITTEQRGGTISMNFYDPEHTLFDFLVVEGLANTVSISLRTGCFCNPGADELAHNIHREDILECFANADRMTFEMFVEAMSARGDYEGVGAVRVSVGLATNFADVYHFLQFARSFLNMPAALS